MLNVNVFVKSNFSFPSQLFNRNFISVVFIQDML